MVNILLSTILLCAAPMMADEAEPPAGEIISTDEMIAHLSQQLDALDGLTLYFTQRQYSGLGASDPPEGGPGPDDFKLECEFKSVISGERYRIESQVIEQSKAFEGAGDQLQILTWNGEQARIRLYSPNGALHDSGQIDSEPTRTVFIEPHMTWQGWWVFQTMERTSYLDLMRSGTLEGPKLLDDGRTSWRAFYQDSRNLMFELIGRRVDDRVELAEAALNAFPEESWEEGATPLARFTIRFDPIRVEKGEPISPRAVMTTHHNQEEPADRIWGSTEVILDHVEREPISDETFYVEFASTAAVSDARYRIAYELGDTLINVDGRLLRTHEPVHGDVGAQLASWVEQGEFVAEEDVMEELGADASDSAATSEGGFGLWPYAILVVSIVVAAIILFYRRGTS
jgi:hypothetical protein